MKTKIAYIINHCSFFESHISPIAIEAKKNHEIKLFCGAGASDEMERYAEKILKKKNISFQKFKFSAAGMNFFLEFVSFVGLLMAVRSFKPDLIHAATPKGILYGGIIAFILKINSVVLYVTGMGFLFSNKLSFSQKILKFFYLYLKKIIFLKNKNLKLIVENKTDYNFYLKRYNLKKKLQIIKGSGVDINKFKPYKVKKKNLVILPARVLKEKGITEFVIAASILKKKYNNWKFLVVGTLNYKKTSSYSVEELNKLNEEKSVEFVGFSKNIINYYKHASIVCLPSYREGFSKTLAEASACGIPIITSNVVGCKDVIINNRSGILCKPKNIHSLKNKLEYLIINKKIRSKLGKFGLKLARREYNLSLIINKNLTIYKELILNNSFYDKNYKFNISTYYKNL